MFSRSVFSQNGEIDTELLSTERSGQGLLRDGVQALVRRTVGGKDFSSQREYPTKKPQGWRKSLKDLKN